MLVAGIEARDPEHPAEWSLLEEIAQAVRLDVHGRDEAGGDEYQLLKDCHQCREGGHGDHRPDRQLQGGRVPDEIGEHEDHENALEDLLATEQADRTGMSGGQHDGREHEQAQDQPRRDHEWPPRDDGLGQQACGHPEHQQVVGIHRAEGMQRSRLKQNHEGDEQHLRGPRCQCPRSGPDRDQQQQREQERRQPHVAQVGAGENRCEDGHPAQQQAGEDGNGQGRAHVSGRSP